MAESAHQTGRYPGTMSNIFFLAFPLLQLSIMVSSIHFKSSTDLVFFTTPYQMARPPNVKKGLRTQYTGWSRIIVVGMFLQIYHWELQRRLLEAARTCQLAPPGNWPFEAYEAIGRNDLANSALQNQDVLVTGGYKTRKEFIVRSRYTPMRLLLMQR
jgi:hypothetical protein